MQLDLKYKLNLSIIGLFLIHTSALSQVAAIVGEPINLNISVEKEIKSNNMKKCSLSIYFPNGEKISRVLAAPDFKITFEFIPQFLGLNAIRWAGENDLNLENAPDKIIRNTLKNLGELFEFKPLTELLKPCPSEGSIKIIAKEKTSTVSPNTSASTQSKNPEQPSQSKFWVTADLPNVLNTPIDQDKLQAITATNAEFKDAIQAFTMKKVESVTLMMIQAKQGEPYAQFFYGLAHTENWTNIYDKKMACYWFRQAAVAGVSQARLYLATKAFKEKECFDVPPTIEQAKIWAQLASMSKDAFVKSEADKILVDIIQIQIEKGN